ncbi:thioesterase family protein [Hypoxylon sp. NC1633]|nr:thioesterase family protein [Hypoxylon sp. NC1633]
MASILHKQINLKQTASHTYTVGYHHDWTIGNTLHGGTVAAVIHHIAVTHLSTTLAAQNQPDILTFHVEFLRACEARDSTVSVTDLKLGTGTSTLQLQLSQGNKVRAVALATSTDLTRPVGPSARTAWAALQLQHPPAPPTPDFAAVLAHRPDAHWLPTRIAGEIAPFTARVLMLYPREGFPVDGVCDTWCGFADAGGERMDATYLALMTDCISSMSDTLLRNGGIFDARRAFADVRDWAARNPGVPAERTNSLAEAARVSVFDITLTLDIEFKRRVPPEGLQWVFTRIATRMLDGGRMDLDITLCDEKMEILCLARQVVLVLDAKRRFAQKPGSKPAL